MSKDRETHPTLAFTAKSENIQRSLRSVAIVQSGSKEFTTTSLWDTGATCTCISEEVVSQLSLIPTGKKTISTPSGARDANTYLINIILPNNVRVADVVVCDSEIGKQGLGVLIGMDIITLGDFSVSNFNQKTTFTFRVPSLRITDYVEEYNFQTLIGSHGQGKRKKKRK